MHSSGVCLCTRFTAPRLGTFSRRRRVCVRVYGEKVRKHVCYKNTSNTIARMFFWPWKDLGKKHRTVRKTKRRKEDEEHAGPEPTDRRIMGKPLLRFLYLMFKMILYTVLYTVNGTRIGFILSRLIWSHTGRDKSLGKALTGNDQSNP